MDVYLMDKILLFDLCQALEALTSASAASLAASKDVRSSAAILSAMSPSIHSLSFTCNGSKMHGAVGSCR